MEAASALLQPEEVPLAVGAGAWAEGLSACLNTLGPNLITLEIIVDMLNSLDIQVKEEACAALLRIVKIAPDCGRDLLRAGGLPPLVELLGASASSATAATLAVHTLLRGSQQSNEFTEAMCFAGALPPLVHQAHNGTKACREGAALLLCRVAAEAPLHRHLLNAQGVVTIVALASFPTKSTEGTVLQGPDVLFDSAAKALLDLAQHESNLLPIWEAGGVPALAGLVSVGLPGAAGRMAWAVYCLAHMGGTPTGTWSKLLTSSPLIPALIQVLEGSDSGARVWASGALSCLAKSGPDISTQLSTHTKLIQVLVGICSDEKEDSEDVQNSFMAVSYLALNEAASCGFQLAGVVPQLLDLAARRPSSVQQQCGGPPPHPPPLLSRHCLVATLSQLLAAPACRAQCIPHASSAVRALTRLIMDEQGVQRQVGMECLLLLLEDPLTSLPILQAGGLACVVRLGSMVQLIDQDEDEREEEDNSTLANQIQVRCAGAVVAATRVRALHCALREAGGLPPLASALVLGPPHMRLLAAKAAASLAPFTENHCEMRESGIVEALVTSLSAPGATVEDQVVAAEALGSLVGIQQALAPPPPSGSDNSSSSSPPQDHCGAQQRREDQEEGNQERTLREDKIQEDHKPEEREEENVCLKEKENVEQVDIIEQEVRVDKHVSEEEEVPIEEGVKRDKEEEEEEEAIRQWNMAENQAAVRDAGGIPVLVWMMLSGHQEVKTGAAAVLEKLGEAPEIRAQVLEARVSVLAELLLSGPPAARPSLAGALMALTQHPLHHPALTCPAALPTLLQIGQKLPDMQDWLAALLRALAARPSNHLALRPAVPHLLASLLHQDPHSPSVVAAASPAASVVNPGDGGNSRRTRQARQNACKSLLLMMVNPQVRDEVRQASGIQVLVEVVTQTPGAESREAGGAGVGGGSNALREMAAEALGLLVEDVDNLQQFCEEGGVAGICTAVSFKCIIAQEKSLQSLKSLVEIQSTHDWIRSAGGIVPLVKLMQNAELEKLREAASWTLKRIAQHSTEKA